jgi:hypothetical protein
MKRILFALILVGLLGTGKAQAGFALEIDLQQATPNPQGSLDHNHLGSDSPLVGTNLSASSVSSSASGSLMTSPMGGFLDFTTGAYDGTNAEGDTLYKAGGNFFILGGPLSTAAGSAPLAYDASTGPAVVKSLGGGVFELTMSITNGYLSSTIAAPLGVTPGYGYDGTLSFDFVVDSTKAGNQLLSGSIQFLGQASPAGNNGPGQDPPAVPEPASVLLVAFGMIGVASARSSRAKRSKAGVSEDDRRPGR